MSQAIVNPAELRRFAQNLKQFSAELANQMALLQRQMASLGESWRDQEHLKFVDEFQQQMPAIGRFADAAGQYTSFLIRKAERAEDYLRQR